LYHQFITIKNEQINTKCSINLALAVTTTYGQKTEKFKTKKRNTFEIEQTKVVALLKASKQELMNQLLTLILKIHSTQSRCRNMMDWAVLVHLLTITYQFSQSKHSLRLPLHVQDQNWF
jgi:hypothetical protein